MASKSNKSGKTTKRTTQKKQTKKRTTNKKVENNTFIRGEIITLASLAVCILLLISNFGFGGFLGDIVSNVLFGIFGLVAYIIPIIIFVGIAFVISNKNNSHAYIKTGAGVVLTAMTCTFIQLITVSYDKADTLMMYYQASSEDKNAGGIVGGAFVKVLCPSIGVAGTFVVVIALMIICMVVITEKSVVHGVKKSSKKAYDAAKEDAKKRKEQAVIRREEKEKNRELKRRDKQVSGVSFDTTLTKKKPDVKEIVPPVMEEIPPMPPMEQMDLPFPDIDMTPVVPEEEIVINRAVPEEIKEPEPQPKKKEKADVESEVADVKAVIEKTQKEQYDYQFPPLSLLTKGKKTTGDSDHYLRDTAMKLQQTLKISA